MKYFIIMAMIFCHILDDYVLQAPCLSNLKQKNTWNLYDKFYEDDWIAALTMHALSWSFMIHLPLAIYAGFNINGWFVLSFVVNAIVHGVVDHLKCNKFKITLIVDQLIHLWQIAITFIIFLGKGSNLL